MKHYLELVSVSAKHRGKQDWMTKICIILSVFLVTVIFSMADMEMRSQMAQAVKTDGSWHVAFVINEEQRALLEARPEVERTARYNALNYYLTEGYQVEGLETGICGFDREFLEMMPDVEILEGEFPENEEGAVINELTEYKLGVGIGDIVTLTTPWGAAVEYRVTGICKETVLTSKLDASIMLLNGEAISKLYKEDTVVSNNL